MKFTCSSPAAPLALCLALTLCWSAQATNRSAIPLSVKGQGVYVSEFVNFGAVETCFKSHAPVGSVGLLKSHGDEDHKPLLPLCARDYVTFILAALSIILASGSGIGGGGVFVPLLLLVSGFSTSKSVAISNLMIMGSALASFLCNIFKKHPRMPGPLIDWDLILVMEPTTILGALLGGYLNKLLPPWLTGLLMALLLTAMAYKLWRKGCELYQKQSKKAREVTLQYSNSFIERIRPLLSPSMSNLQQLKLLLTEELTDEESIEDDVGPQRDQEDVPGSDARVYVGTDVSPAGESSLDDKYHAVIRSEARQVPFEKFAALLLLAACVLASDNLKALLPCGSASYWLVVLAVVPVALVTCLGMRAHLLKKMAVKREAGHRRQQDEVHWTPRTTVVYPTICTLAGVIAGLFGVGGGIVKGPLMLELGLVPEVVSATSSTMILFTAGTASVLYIQFGTVDGVWDYALVLLVMGFLLTLVGQLLTRWLLQVFGRCVIVFMMFAILALSAMAMYYQTARNMVAIKHHPEYILEWGNICVPGVDP